MKRIIADSLARGFSHPCIKGLPQWLAFILNREVYECRRSAESRGARSGFEIVSAGGSTKRHVEMRVDIDAAGENELSSRIHNLRSILDGKVGANSGNLSADDRNVGFVCVSGRHDKTV